jgi:hypothetical protein
MNPFKYIYPILVAALVLVLIIIASYLTCSRKKEKYSGNGTDKIFIQQGLLEADKKNSIEQRKARRTIDSLMQLLKAEQAIEKKTYYYYQQKGERAEVGFSEGLVTCDTVIALKNKALALGNRIIARCDSLHGLDSLKSNSFGKELAGKDSTIGKLNDMLVMEQTKKKPVEVFATLNGTKYPDYGNLGIGAVVVFPKGLLIGYSKGIIKNSHDLTVGYQLKFGK